MDLGQLLLGAISLMLLVGIVIFGIEYVLYGISHMKMFKMVGYENYWMAWIPVACYYALADCVRINDVNIFGAVIPKHVFKLWWILLFVLNLIPGIGNILALVLKTICRGWCYNMIFSYTDNKPYSETRVLAYIAGFIPVIAVFKYLFRKSTDIYY